MRLISVAAAAFALTLALSLGIAPQRNYIPACWRFAIAK
jgi:hypothetical protein